MANGKRKSRIADASERLYREEGINTAGMSGRQVLKTNKKSIKSNLRQKTTSGMEEYQAGRAKIEASKGPKVEANVEIKDNLNPSSTATGGKADSGSTAYGGAGGEGGDSNVKVVNPHNTRMQKDINNWQGPDRIIKDKDAPRMTSPGTPSTPEPSPKQGGTTRVDLKTSPFDKPKQSPKPSPKPNEGTLSPAPKGNLDEVMERLRQEQRGKTIPNTK